MKKKIEALEAKQRAEAQAAQAIIARADQEKREPTAEEKEQVKAHLDEARKLKAQVDALKADEAVRAELATLGAALETVREATGDANSFPTLGAFLQAVAYAGMPGRNVDPRLLVTPSGVGAVASGLSSGVASDGGYLVQTQFSTAMLQRALETSVLAQRCDRIPIGDGFDGLEAPMFDESSRATGSRWGGVRVYRAAEADTVTSSKPKFMKFELRLEDLMAICYATDRSLRDATSLEAVVTKAFASEESFVLDDEIVRGTGVGQCLGLLTSPETVTIAKEGGQGADTVIFENIVKMWAALRGRYRANAAWYINQEIEPQLFAMSLAVGMGGVPVYLPANGLADAPYGRLFGRPVIPIEQASALGDLGDIILADLSQYLLIDKPGTADQSMHVRFIYNERTFRFVYPVNGAPKPGSKITPYKGAQDLSAFVTLAARA